MNSIYLFRLKLIPALSLSGILKTLGGSMDRMKEMALRARLRALEAARRLGNKDDERVHLLSIRRLIGRKH